MLTLCMGAIKKDSKLRIIRKGWFCSALAQTDITAFGILSTVLATISQKG